MDMHCGYCEKGSVMGGLGICLPCLDTKFPAVLEVLRRECPHDYELLDREHQTDSEPVSMTSSVIRSVVIVSHFDTLICLKCGGKCEVAEPCNC
jgi:hypothetical protein